MRGRKNLDTELQTEKMQNKNVPDDEIDWGRVSVSACRSNSLCKNTQNILISFNHQT
jgi:hypothetical protein